MKCASCGWEWEKRKEKPRTCPRCRQYIDKPKLLLNKQLKAQKVIEVKQKQEENDYLTELKNVDLDREDKSSFEDLFK